MTTYTLRTQMIVPVSVRDAFTVFEDPLRLAEITPPGLQFRILTPPPVVMAAGLEIDYEFRWLGFPVLWRSRITEYEPPFLFGDEQVKGPFRLWRHRHSFHPSEEGTLVSDEVQYALPLGPVGSFVHKAIVSGQLKEIFRYRQKALSEIISHGRARWTDPVIMETPR
jgi:hypothetical protein